MDHSTYPVTISLSLQIVQSKIDTIEFSTSTIMRRDELKIIFSFGQIEAKLMPNVTLEQKYQLELFTKAVLKQNHALIWTLARVAVICFLTLIIKNPDIIFTCRREPSLGEGGVTSPQFKEPLTMDAPGTVLILILYRKTHIYALVFTTIPIQMTPRFN